VAPGLDQGPHEGAHMVKCVVCMLQTVSQLTALYMSTRDKGDTGATYCRQVSSTRDGGHSESCNLLTTIPEHTAVPPSLWSWWSHDFTNVRQQTCMLGSKCHKGPHAAQGLRGLLSCPLAFRTVASYSCLKGPTSSGCTPDHQAWPSH